MQKALPIYLLFFLLTHGCAPPPNPAPTPTSTAPAAAPKSYAGDTEMQPGDQEHPPPGFYEKQRMENYNPGAYDDRFRPEYHFTPARGWMNDPNGMVYHDGEWHLFYQHYPEGNTWGPMHWGHAVSTDLVNWQHLPIALYPDDLGYIFSGSAIVDYQLRTPFSKNGKPALIAMFTYHDMVGEKAGRTDYQSQAIAYSNDRGRTWTKYAGNPVIPNNGQKDFRDPKVVWDDKTDRFTMVLAAHDHVEFFSSKDMIEWEYLSSFGKDQPEQFGVWECPELIPMTIEETGKEGYVLLVSTNPGGLHGGSGTYYYTGNWDGKTFQPFEETAYNKPGTKWLDYGKDNYAGVTFGSVPESDGRTIFMGWMSNWQYANEVPTEGWRSAMTVPRTLTLHDDPDFGYLLSQLPVTELAARRGERIDLPDYFQDGITTIDLRKLDNPGVFELNCSVDLHGNSESLYFTLHDEENKHFYRFGFDRQTRDGKWLFTSRNQAGLTQFKPEFTEENLVYLDRFSNESVIDFRVLFDRTSAEVFIDEGRSVATDIFFPTTDFVYLTIEVSGGKKDMDGDVGFSVEDGWIYGL